MEIKSPIDLIRADLALFADDDPEISVRDRKIYARWTMFEAPKSAIFSPSTGPSPVWIDNEEHNKKYEDFLSSPNAANLGRLAREITKRHTASAAHSQRQHIPAPAARLDDIDVQVGTASDIILDILKNNNSGSGRTQIVFLKGDAGAGKTYLLRQLSEHSSSIFKENSPTPIMLFVSAQGRSLANLKEILAREVQDLKAQFRYSAIPRLCRAGLIIPVIDAFDELLGAAGYGDAFGSLQDFLEELGGHGSMVVSARSAFYETEFRTRYGLGSSASFEVIPVELSRWRPSDVRLYLNSNDPSGRAVLDYDTLPEVDRQLLSKPFFAEKYLEFVESQENHENNKTDIVDYLMQAYVRRESDKLIGRDNKPLLSHDQQEQFLSECADYMWHNQTRFLDKKSLELIADYFSLEHKLSEDQSQQFQTKVTSNAGVSTSDTGFSGEEGAFRFEHDVYFDYFLSRKAQKALTTNSSEFYKFLQRGQVSPDLMRFTLNTRERAEFAAQILASTASPDIGTYETTRRNRGVMASAPLSLHSDFMNNRSIREADFVGVDIGSISDTTIYGINFISTNFTNSGF
jgi:hypothetical protein